MHSGAAGHAMLEAMFPRVKLERKTSPKKFVAANGEQIRDLGEKNIKTNEGCITFRSASVVKPLISMQEVVRAGNIVVLHEKNPHIRNTRDGKVIKLDVSNGVYTMDMWICLDEAGPVFSRQGTVSGQAAFDKPIRPAALCRGETAEDRKLEEAEETELKEGEEGQDERSDEGGGRIDGEEELAAPDWRVSEGRAQKQIDTEGERGARSNTRTVQRLVCRLHDGKRLPTHHHVTKQR